MFTFDLFFFGSTICFQFSSVYTRRLVDVKMNEAQSNWQSVIFFCFSSVSFSFRKHVHKLRVQLLVFFSFDIDDDNDYNVNKIAFEIENKWKKMRA